MRIFACFIMCWAIPLFAGTIRHDVDDQKYIEYGEKYECVLRLDGILEENGKEIRHYGSCTAISERWIITAAHVVKNSKVNFVVIKIKNQEAKEKKIFVKKTIIHPNFRYGSYGPSDLALCRLEDDLNLSHYPEIYKENNEIGKVCGMAGYGKTGTGITGAVLASDIKRGGSNRIEMVSADFVRCVMNLDRPTELEFLISHGDSGGGLFIDGKIAGVHSYVNSTNGKADSNYGDESCHIRLSKPEHIEWIISTLKNN